MLVLWTIRAISFKFTRLQTKNLKLTRKSPHSPAFATRTRIYIAGPERHRFPRLGTAAGARRIRHREQPAWSPKQWSRARPKALKAPLSSRSSKRPLIRRATSARQCARALAAHSYRPGRFGKVRVSCIAQRRVRRAGRPIWHFS